MALSQGELVALYFAEKVLAQYRGTPFERDLESAFRKIQELLPQEVRVSPAKLDDFLSFDAGPLHTPDAEVFRAVLAALRLRRRVLIRYRSLSSDRTTERRVHPYHVFNHRGDWYLAAFDEARKDVRIFALHRIRRATPTTGSYELPPDFSFAKYMADAFGVQKGDKPVQRVHPLRASAGALDPRAPLAPLGQGPGRPRRQPRPQPDDRRDERDRPLGAAVRQRGRSARTALAPCRRRRAARGLPRRVPHPERARPLSAGPRSPRGYTRSAFRVGETRPKGRSPLAAFPDDGARKTNDLTSDVRVTGARSLRQRKQG